MRTAGFDERLKFFKKALQVIPDNFELKQVAHHLQNTRNRNKKREKKENENEKAKAIPVVAEALPVAGCRP